MLNILGALFVLVGMLLVLTILGYFTRGIIATILFIIEFIMAIIIILLCVICAIPLLGIMATFLLISTVCAWVIMIFDRTKDKRKKYRIRRKRRF